MDRWLNVGVKGSAAWPSEEMAVEFGRHKLLLKPAKRETEQSIHIKLHDLSQVEALTLINRFLSVLAWCGDQPMENLYGWSGSAVPVAVSRESRMLGSSLVFPLHLKHQASKKTRLALALFREARTINSGPFEFLGYFKILNIFWRDKWVSVKGQRQNPIVEGIRATLPRLKDHLAVSRLRDLGASKRDVAKYLYESGRCAVAHAYADPIVDPDDVADLHRLSEDLHIVKEIAEHLIETELSVPRSIFG
jgi:hypothetical protein